MVDKKLIEENKHLIIPGKRTRGQQQQQQPQQGSRARKLPRSQRQQQQQQKQQPGQEKPGTTPLPGGATPEDKREGEGKGQDKDDGDKVGENKSSTSPVKRKLFPGGSGRQPDASGDGSSFAEALQADLERREREELLARRGMVSGGDTPQRVEQFWLQNCEVNFVMNLPPQPQPYVSPVPPPWSPLTVVGSVRTPSDLSSSPFGLGADHGTGTFNSLLPVVSSAGAFRTPSILNSSRFGLGVDHGTGVFNSPFSVSGFPDVPGSSSNGSSSSNNKRPAGSSPGSSSKRRRLDNSDPFVGGSPGGPNLDPSSTSQPFTTALSNVYHSISFPQQSQQQQQQYQRIHRSSYFPFDFTDVMGLPAAIPSIVSAPHSFSEAAIRNEARARARRVYRDFEEQEFQLARRAHQDIHGPDANLPVNQETRDMLLRKIRQRTLEFFVRHAYDDAGGRDLNATSWEAVVNRSVAPYLRQRYGRYRNRNAMPQNLKDMFTPNGFVRPPGAPIRAPAHTFRPPNRPLTYTMILNEQEQAQNPDREPNRAPSSEDDSIWQQYDALPCETRSAHWTATSISQAVRLMVEQQVLSPAEGARFREAWVLNRSHGYTLHSGNWGIAERVPLIGRQAPEGEDEPGFIFPAGTREQFAANTVYAVILDAYLREGEISPRELNIIVERWWLLRENAERGGEDDGDNIRGNRSSGGGGGNGGGGDNKNCKDSDDDEDDDDGSHGGLSRVERRELRDQRERMAAEAKRSLHFTEFYSSAMRCLSDRDRQLEEQQRAMASSSSSPYQYHSSPSQPEQHTSSPPQVEPHNSSPRTSSSGRGPQVVNVNAGRNNDIFRDLSQHEDQSWLRKRPLEGDDSPGNEPETSPSKRPSPPRVRPARTAAYLYGNFMTERQRQQRQALAAHLSPPRRPGNNANVYTPSPLRHETMSSTSSTTSSPFHTNGSGAGNNPQQQDRVPSTPSRPLRFVNGSPGRTPYPRRTPPVDGQTSARRWFSVLDPRTPARLFWQMWKESVEHRNAQAANANANDTTFTSTTNTSTELEEEESSRAVEDPPITTGDFNNSSTTPGSRAIPDGGGAVAPSPDRTLNTNNTPVVNNRRISVILPGTFPYSSSGGNSSSRVIPRSSSSSPMVYNSSPLQVGGGGGPMTPGFRVPSSSSSSGQQQQEEDEVVVEVESPRGAAGQYAAAGEKLFYYHPGASLSPIVEITEPPSEREVEEEEVVVVDPAGNNSGEVNITNRTIDDDGDVHMHSRFTVGEPSRVSSSTQDITMNDPNTAGQEWQFGQG